MEKHLKLLSLVKLLLHRYNAYVVMGKFLGDLIRSLF